MKAHPLPPRSARGLLAGGLIGAAALVAASTQAATITWGLPTNIAGDSDVSTTGTLIGAFNLGGTAAAPTTINGVAFASLAVAGTSVTAGDFTLATGAGSFGANDATGSASAPFSSLSPDYQVLLRSVAGQGSGSPAFTLTMNGLVVGEQYEFQWWMNSSGLASAEATSASAGNSVTLQANVGTVVGGVGQYAIGTFIADAASQTVSFANAGQGSNFLNGFQLRQVTQPPPPPNSVPDGGGTLVLLGLALCGVLVPKPAAAWLRARLG